MKFIIKGYVDQPDGRTASDIAEGIFPFLVSQSIFISEGEDPNQESEHPSTESVVESVRELLANDGRGLYEGCYIVTADEVLAAAKQVLSR